MRDVLAEQGDRRRRQEKARLIAKPLDRLASDLGGQMQIFQIPTQAEQDVFLLRLYFGVASPLCACIDRAYLDFSRTLHGISRLAGAAVLRAEAGKRLCSWLAKLPDLNADPNRGTFDAWHRELCEQLCTLYARHGPAGVDLVRDSS
jgi:hypothetical protein